MDLCNFLCLNAQNERKSSNLATETRLNRDGKAPTKNENGRNVNHRDNLSRLLNEKTWGNSLDMWRKFCIFALLF